MSEDTQTPKPDPDNTVQNIDRQPCGCTVTEYESGRRVYAPCPPCGLFQVASEMQDGAVLMRRRFVFNRRKKAGLHFHRAAMALAAVATTLQQEQIKAIRQQQFAEAVEKMRLEQREKDQAELDGIIKDDPTEE